MLHRIDRFAELDGRKLMDLYAEGNRENAEYFYPDMDPDAGTQRVEREFLAFLRDEFLPQPENTYWVLEENGAYRSALRLTELSGRLFYLEALETHPDCRRQGYAVRLLREVTDALRAQGPFRICDCVSKRNIPSIEAHKKAGFQIVSEEGYDYLQGKADANDYVFAYTYPTEP